MNPIQRAEVYVQDTLAGSIERTQSGSKFEYVDGYQGPPVASTIPLETRIQQTYGVNLHAFFANLLPEGLRLDAIKSRVKTSIDDRLTLLLASGEDTIGDVSLCSDEALPSKQRPDFDLKTDSFRELYENRYGANPSHADRVSIPGVQEKISASRISLPVSIPRRHHPETILKLNLRPELRPKIVENENFFMKTAATCGLITATCDLVHDHKGETALAVGRFDRVRNKTKLTKLHQEDACQILDIYPDSKYAVNIQDIAKGLQQVCTAPQVEILRLIELYAFSYLIANGDLHAKNVSTLRDQNGITRLSPAYDLLSTWPYKDHTMALKLDGRNDNFNLSHFVKFGARFQVKEKAITNTITRIYEAIEPCIGQVETIGLPDNLAGPMQNVMKLRRSKLMLAG